MALAKVALLHLQISRMALATVALRYLTTNPHRFMAHTHGLRLKLGVYRRSRNHLD